MWKESLRIGVEKIDDQHRALFQKTEELLREICDRGVGHKEKCISAILFLKEYAVNHFADEEDYQRSIGYIGFAEHKKLHVDFVENVLLHEKKMVKSDFAEKEIKEFTGMLVAWLLYHVAGADQEIVQERKPLDTPKGHADIVSHSVFDVLNKLAALDSSPMKKVEKHDETFDESLAFEVTLTGDVSGYITYAYPLTFVKQMINSMMGFTPETIDELEVSALFEVSNIISGAICGQIATEKNIRCGMKTPFMTQRLDVQPEERIALDTGKGIVEVDLAITYKK